MSPKEMLTLLTDALVNLNVLAGNEVGRSDQSWQDVARDCAERFRSLADAIDEAQAGGMLIVFPDPAEALDAVNAERN